MTIATTHKMTLVSVNVCCFSVGFENFYALKLLGLNSSLRLSFFNLTNEPSCKENTENKTLAFSIELLYPEMPSCPPYEALYCDVIISKQLC